MNSPHRRIAWYVFLAAWLVYAATTGGTMATNDAVSIYESAKSWVERGTLDVPASQSAPSLLGRDGRYYVPYGIGQTLYAIPFVVAGRAIVRIADVRLGDDDAVPKAMVVAGNTLPAAVSVMFGFLLAWRLSGHLLGSVLAAFALAFGTLLWPYSKFGFNTALAAAGLTAGAYGIAAGFATRTAGVVVGASAALGFAMLVRHELAIGAVACAAWFVWGVRRDAHRVRLITAVAVPLVVAGLIEVAFNAYRFGDPFWTGYAPGFSGDGFLAYLVSPSGSILIYSPVVVGAVGLIPLALAGHPVARLLLSVSGALFFFYASLADWLGTRSYGPRYLVPLLPIAVAPLAVWIAGARSATVRLGLAGLFALSLSVQVPGILVDFSRVGIEAGQPPQTERRNDWRWSPLRLNIAASARIVPEAIESLVEGRPTGVSGTEGAMTTRLPLSLDFWWMHVFLLGIVPAAAALAAPAILVAGAAALATRAARIAANTS